MAFMICLLGAIWLGLIAIGLWKVALGLKAVITRQATLRNFRFRVTRYGPTRLEDPPTRVVGPLALRHGIVQVLGGLLIAGPLGLVPLLGGGFPWTILLGPVIGLAVTSIGTRIIIARARRLERANSRFS